jgi:hypothetical protein
VIVNVLVHRLKEVINSPKLDPYKSEHFDEMLPLYQKCELENWSGQGSRCSMGNMGMFQDRTRTLPHYLKMGGWEVLPEYDPNYCKPFNDIALEAAEAIVKRANGSRISISWSGGLDSTGALFSLMEFADPKQLKVFCNYNSIIESGALFDTYIKGRGIEYSLTTPLMHPTFDEGLIVSGYLGDQLFGQYHNLQPEHFTMSWKDYLNRDQVEVMERIVANWPGAPIVTVPEFLSFNELNSKWQMGKTNRMRNMPKVIADRMINFYETVDFQKWSIGRYAEKYLNADRTTHKWAIKLLLQKLMKSDDYPMNKIVQTSHYHILEHEWVMTLEDGTNLYLKDFK